MQVSISDYARVWQLREDFLVFGAPVIGESDIAEVVDTLRSGWIGFGPKCQRLEADFAAYLGRPTEHAVAVSSCTAALHLSLVASDVKPGDEVITTPLTFAATVNAIMMTGAIPVFVDIDPATQNIDAAAIAAAVTVRTRAVIPVHMAGRLCDIAAIRAVAARYDLSVIEDAAHAVEAAEGGVRVGATSPFACFSFYATKNMTTGDGGMLLVRDGVAAERVRRLRFHGMSRDAWARYGATGFRHYEIVEPGFKYSLTDMQAALGLHQLRRLDSNLAIRESLWAAYDALLRPLNGIRTPQRPPDSARHARHLYTVEIVPEELGLSRDEVLNGLTERRVGTGVHFKPVHLHPYYRDRYGFREGMFPHAEHVGQTTLSLPLSGGLTLGDVRHVVGALNDIASSVPRKSISLDEPRHAVLSIGGAR